MRIRIEQAQTAEQKYEVERLQRELHEIKHKYYAQKKVILVSHRLSYLSFPLGRLSPTLVTDLIDARLA